MSRTLMGLAVGLALLVVLGGLALATLSPTPQDFAPFTMRVTTWTAAASQRDGEAPQAGKVVQLLQYRSVDSWTLTVLSSTWDPGVVGMKIEVNDGSHSTFISQAQRFFSRAIPANEAGRTAPLPWVFPGIFDGLSGSMHYQSVSKTPAGTATFISRESVTSTGIDGTLQVLTGTVLVFDVASRLPLSRHEYRSGILAESMTYEVVSRP